MPEFEQDEQPDLVGVIAPAALVVGPKLFERWLVEVSTRRRGFAEQQVARYRAQFLPQPLGNRQAKALLLARENLARDEARRGLLENVFPLRAVEFET